MKIKEISKLNIFYGHSKIIKDYCGYPLKKPLPILIAHGLNNLYKLDDEHFNEFLFDYWVWNEEVRQFNINLYKISPENIYNFGAPFIYLADEYLSDFDNTEPQGTIAFPSHLNPGRPVDEWYDEYAQLLKDLPEEFQPITVSLHPYDISKGLHQVFQKYGFTTVTCSPLVLENYQEIKKNPGVFWKYYNHGGPYFLDHFLKLCKGKKYATSNKIAAASYYSAYLGLRFFIYHGNQPGHLLRQEQNFTPEENEEYRKIKSFFSMENLEQAINSEMQRELAQEKLGVQYKQGKKELRYFLERLFNSRKYVQRQYEQQTELEKAKAEISRLKQDLETTGIEEQPKVVEIEVLNVIKSLKESDLLLANSLDRPKRGKSSNQGKLNIAGWVFGKNSPVVAIEIISEGKVLQKLEMNVPRPDVIKSYPEASVAKNCGFETNLSISELPQVVDIGLEAVLANEKRASIGYISIRHQSNVSGSNGIVLTKVEERLKRADFRLQEIKQKIQV
ncbi:hypothetical protein [Okeania sp. KiyG1]|uniref:hypothetical protein n=1 Tax=Okeania sp. KiyG1 TaxID=2720165 RepID=UPI0019237437|nr:hypothetical protein [Okeania sp. KiyG1]GGA21609.1 hypothetical protein CYANOKiyG1_36660 [Okeania sp. KiyG1]